MSLFPWQAWKVKRPWKTDEVAEEREQPDHLEWKGALIDGKSVATQFDDPGWVKHRPLWSQVDA